MKSSFRNFNFIKEQILLLKFLLSLFIIAFTSSFLTSQTSNENIDKIAGNIPENIGNDIDSITLYIAEKSKTDLEKARGIFTWIITNISYDRTSTEGAFPVGKDLSEILKSKKAICIGYAKLFQKMCFIAGLECEVISGYSHENPTSKVITDAPDHAWNAVLLNGEWHLIDATWSAALRKSKPGKKLNPEVETYFMPQPSIFLNSHLPAQPWWQLLSSPIDMQTFRSGPDYIASQLLHDNHYTYRDSIKAFRALPPQIKKLREAEVGWKFLPNDKNLKQYIAVLMEYASEITDSLTSLQSEGQLDSLISKQITLIDLCRYTKRLGTLLPWQMELYAEALINHIVSLHKNAKGRPDKKLKKELLSLMEEAMTILNETPDSYYTQSAKIMCQQISDVIGQ